MRSFTPPNHELPWPDEEPGDRDESDELDDNPLELDDRYWEAFLPDDDYEPHPEPGDFGNL